MGSYKTMFKSIQWTQLYGFLLHTHTINKLKF